jgi:hypothetical protein
MKLEDQTWVAILGDLQFPDNCIVGSGKSPAEALMAWDMVFTGRMQAQTIEVRDEPKKPARQPRKNNGK